MVWIREIRFKNIRYRLCFSIANPVSLPSTQSIPRRPWPEIHEILTNPIYCANMRSFIKSAPLYLMLNVRIEELKQGSGNHVPALKATDALNVTFWIWKCVQSWRFRKLVHTF
jgi:hypothetical protein